jgi:hypothetical protein
VSSGGSAREQENPEVRGGVGLANQSSSIVLLHGPRHPAALTLHRSSEQDHNTSKKLLNPIESLRSLNTRTSSPRQHRLSSPWITVRNTSPVILHPLQFPTDFFVIHGTSSPSSSSYRRFCSPREFTFHPLFSTTKATPRFALIFLLSIFSDQGLNYFDLESSRVFFVKFPKLSLFQISELLHFIDFHRKFIKM